MKKLTFLALFAAGLVQAESLTIERIFQSPSLAGSEPQMLKVSPDGERVTYIKGKENDYERFDLWEYNLQSGKNQLLFDADDLHSGPEILSDEEKARRERMRVFGSGIMNYQWAKDGKALLFPLAGDAYYYRLGDAKAKQLLKTPEFETDVRLSPKGNYLSYIREQNLFILDIKTGQETQLTSDGGNTIKYGMAEFVAQEEMGRMTGYWWSPDESKIAFTKVDTSPVELVTRSEIYADSIKTITQRYPSAGTPNVLIELAVMTLPSKELQWVDLGKNKDIYLARAKWMNNDVLTYQWQDRPQQTLELRAFNSATGKQKVLLTETSNTWINLHKDLRFLDDNEHFLWASERDGYKHLYLYKNNGKRVRQLTKGKWIVDKIEAVDQKEGFIYFSGRKDTPTERHLYKVAIKGSKIERVSQRKGMHNIAFSRDASIYVDNFSTSTSPPQVSLHSAGGKRLTWLSENRLDAKHPLAPYQKDWVQPKFGVIKADNGMDLHYRLFKPKNLKQKHPVIVYAYGGPHVQIVTNSWGGNRGLLMQHWVNKGYVVFTLDNRGSYNRGKAFEDPIYQKMGAVEVDDQVAGVKFLRTLPYVDAKRIGIYGHSYGGYMAQMAMFKAGDYYAAGVSGAPVTDWLLYDTHYTERYMGNPNQVNDAYTASSVFPYAKDLQGDLLIYHGMADDNVLFTHATKIYKHLQDMAKPFESMDYPGKKHSIRGKKTSMHLFHTITNFFDRTIGNSRASK